jgi:hypothetical protein
MSRKSKRDKDLVLNNTVEIPLAFTKENLATLLADIINEACTYSHQDFANWATDFHMHIIGLFDKGMEGDDELEELVLDIDMQWDLYLTNSYTLEELQTMDKSKVRLPKKWFEDWLKQLQ